MNRFIIDGFNQVFRAHFAFKDLMTTSGLQSGCIYGFLNILKSLKAKFRDFDFYVVWDTGSDKKKQIFSDYKANRNSFRIDAPINDLQELLTALNITQVHSEKEEADDVIATLVNQRLTDDSFEGKDYIYSSDKDLMQLVVDGKIIVVRPKTPAKPEQFYDEEAVKREHGVQPGNLAVFLSLRGDTSDNIPGVSRVPSKVLTRLCETYGDLQNIYDNLVQESLTDFQRMSLQKFREQAFLNFSIIKLRTDLFCSSYKGQSNKEYLQKYLDKYEIKSYTAENYIDLFNANTSFLKRSGPAVRTVSLFDGEE